MKWIKLTDKLPIKDGEYLVVTEMNKGKFISVLLFDVDEEEWKEYDSRYDEYVCVGGTIYWQPLTKLPK